MPLFGDGEGASSGKFPVRVGIADTFGVPVNEVDCVGLEQAERTNQGRTSAKIIGDLFFQSEYTGENFTMTR